MSDMPKTAEKSVDVEAVLFTHLPALQRYPFPLRRLFIWVLKALVIEDRINRFFCCGIYLRPISNLYQNLAYILLPFCFGLKTKRSAL